MAGEAVRFDEQLQRVTREQTLNDRAHTRRVGASVIGVLLGEALLCFFVGSTAPLTAGSAIVMRRSQNPNAV